MPDPNSIPNRLTPDPPARRGSEDEKAGRCPMCGNDIDVEAGADIDKTGLCYACWQRVRGPSHPDALRNRQPAVRKAVADIERAKRVSRETLEREIDV